MEYAIYNVTYNTQIAAQNSAVIATDSQGKIESILKNISTNTQEE